MQKKIILIPDRISNPDIEEKVLSDEYEVICPLVTNEKDINDRVWESAVAILAWHDLTYSKDLIAKLKSCKVIVRVGVGFDNVDLEAAKKRNLLAGLHNGTAEYAQKMIDKGFNLVTVGSDSRYIGSGAKSDLEILKGIKSSKSKGY